MPELPEVETIRRGLEKKIVGLTVKDIQILNRKTFQGDEKLIIGKKIVGVWRRAKILGIDLMDARGPVGLYPRPMSSLVSLTAGTRRGTPSPATPHSAPPALTLLFHLKMTGQLIYIPNNKQSTKNSERLIGGHPTSDMKDKMPNKHTRVIFEFNPLRPRSEASGSKLYFNDLRKFGWIKLVDSSWLLVHGHNLGPEPLDKTFSWKIFKENLLKHKNLPVKVAIMDQKVVAGVGNIYASESLFEAGIDPRRKVASLSNQEFRKLTKGIKTSLEIALKYGGSTIANFVDSEGKKGYFIDYAKVYGKDGKKCPNCLGQITKIQQAGRGTYWCPACQR